MNGIYVWGTGICAVNFTHMNANEKIEAYIDSNKTEDIFSVNGIPIIRPEQIRELPKRYVVIACGQSVYWEIKRQLELYGLNEFTDYCYYKIYKKKIALIYGNCHIAPIREGLENSEQFSEEYGFYPLRMIQEINQTQGEDLKLQVFERCELFIHQEIRDKNQYGFEYSSSALLKRISPSCKVISIPNLYGLPKYLFPQIDGLLPEKRVKNRAYFSFRDKYIEAMYERGRDIDYIVDKIKWGGIEEIEKAELFSLQEQFLQKVSEREKAWDIKISGWLEETLGKKHLFYDVNHPTNEVIKYIVNNLLKVLHIDNDVNLEYLPRLDMYEIPIYGALMEGLGMVWKNDYILRNYSKYTMTDRAINLHQYVRQYILWNYYRMQRG